MRPALGLGLFVGLALLAPPPAAPGQATKDKEPEATRRATCAWADPPPKVDGDLDDPAWAKAAVIDKFPSFWAGTRSGDGTRARLLWDKDALYYSATMTDAELRSFGTRRNDRIWNGDVFELFFKPDADRLEDPAQLDLGQLRLGLVQAGPQHQVPARRDERDAQAPVRGGVRLDVRPCARQRRSRRAPHAREPASDDHNVRHRRSSLSLAPGGSHLLLEPGGVLHLDTHTPARRGHRPSADELFLSCTCCAGEAAGVLMTGMGADGVEGLLALRKAGGLTLAQDEASSIIFGMPRVALEKGAADVALPPRDLARALVRVWEKGARR